MPEFYTLVILIITRLGEFGEKQLLVFSSRGGANWALNAGSSFICVFVFHEKADNLHFCQIDLSRGFTRYTWGWSFCYYQMDDPIRYI